MIKPCCLMKIFKASFFCVPVNHTVKWSVKTHRDMADHEDFKNLAWNPILFKGWLVQNPDGRKLHLHQPLVVLWKVLGYLPWTYIYVYIYIYTCTRLFSIGWKLEDEANFLGIAYYFWGLQYVKCPGDTWASTNHVTDEIPGGRLG